MPRATSSKSTMSSTNGTPTATTPRSIRRGRKVSVTCHDVKRPGSPGRFCKPLALMPPFSWSAALAGGLLHREGSEFAVAGKSQGERMTGSAASIQFAKPSYHYHLFWLFGVLVTRNDGIHAPVLRPSGFFHSCFQQ